MKLLSQGLPSLTTQAERRIIHKLSVFIREPHFLQKTPRKGGFYSRFKHRWITWPAFSPALKTRVLAIHGIKR